jgi:hypothetical protein
MGGLRAGVAVAVVHQWQHCCVDGGRIEDPQSGDDRFAGKSEHNAHHGRAETTSKSAQEASEPAPGPRRKDQRPMPEELHRDRQAANPEGTGLRCQIDWSSQEATIGQTDLLW